MTDSPRHPLRLLLLSPRLLIGERSPIFSPAGFAVRAAILSAVFLALHLAGARGSTSILSGTWPADRTARMLAVSVGSAYTVLYLLFVFVVPVLLLTSGLFAVLLAWGATRTSTPAAADDGHASSPPPA